MEYIYFYDDNGVLRSLPFDLVFNEWIESLGGKDKFLNLVSKLSQNGFDVNIPYKFYEYFIFRYNARFPEEGDMHHQEHLFDPIFYRMKVQGIAIIENERKAETKSSIIWFAVVGAILLYIMVKCSE